MATTGCPRAETLLEIVERFPQGHAGDAIDAHLDQCDPCRRLVADLVRAAAADQRATVPLRNRVTARILRESEPDATEHAEPPASGALQPGDVVGRYAITRLVGAGGMGYVYAAHDPELDRDVALKIMRPHVPGLREGEGRARLLAEAQLLARIVHPNVVTVFDVGSDGDRVFLAMELVDGVTVADWLREKRRGWREIVDVFRAAGRGLAAAHAKGMIHRDFKPANILIDRGGRVLVTDFGLARSLGEPPRSRLEAARGSGTFIATNAGQLLGTPPYMAPEQHRGEHADCVSDQFSFCVALHEALCGELPFDGDTYEALHRAMTHGEPRQPPKGATMPGWLRAVIVRGLAADPAARWRSMEAVLAQLDVAKHVRRRWAFAGLVVLASAAGALGAIGLRTLDRTAGSVVPPEVETHAGLNLAALEPAALAHNDLTGANFGAAGIGSPAFADVVERNRAAGAAMYAALTRMAAGWQLVVWGAKASAVFTIAAPPAATWDQIAAFVRAVWRWNAPAAMTLQLGSSGEPGRLGVAALVATGSVTARDYEAGLLGFVTATLNSDASAELTAWLRRADGTGQLLGGADTAAHVDAGFAVVDNGDRSVGVWVTDPTGEDHELMSARYSEFVRGLSNQRPVADSCAFALLNEQEWNTPLPAARCGPGLRHEGMPHVTPGVPYTRCGTRGGATACVERPVVSETYVHTRGPGFHLVCGTTCEHERAECGTIANRCDGGVLACGTCEPGLVCSHNRCVRSTHEEVEPNDTARAAGVIAAPFTAITGTIARTGDRDYFAITLPAGAKLTALLLPPSYANPPLDYELALHASDGTIVAESIHMGAERVELANPAREPRVLFLEVYAYGDGFASPTHPYVLDVEW